MDANSKPEVVWEGDQAFIAVDGVKVIKYSEHGSTAAEAGWRIERVTLQDTDAFWPALQLSYNDEPLNWLICIDKDGQPHTIQVGTRPAQRS
jgi:hypothetical protein